MCWVMNKLYELKIAVNICWLLYTSCNFHYFPLNWLLQHELWIQSNIIPVVIYFQGIFKSLYNLVAQLKLFIFFWHSKIGSWNSELVKRSSKLWNRELVNRGFKRWNRELIKRASKRWNREVVMRASKRWHRELVNGEIELVMRASKRWNRELVNVEIES